MGLPGRTHLLWVLLTLLCTGAPAAQNVGGLADLSLSQLADMPIVSAARHEQSRSGSPRAVSVITAEEIRRRNFRNVPDAVGTIAGVYLQQTNYGGGSPIIRGMVGNRILLMLDGVRLNNGTFRLGPNQYLNFIDINQVDRIEVVRGAGSVLYGSDAFGGIINIITKAAPDPRAGAELTGFTRVRFATADASGAGRAQVAGAHGRVGFLAGFTHEQFGDLKAGGGRGVQPFTGYGHTSGDLRVRFAVGGSGTLTAGVSRLELHDVPRTDILAAGSELQHLWTGQGRDHLYMQYEQSDVGPLLNAVQFTLSYARPFESLNRILRSAPAMQRRHSDLVHMLEAGVQITTLAGPRHVFTWGATATNDVIRSSRFDVDLGTGSAVRKSGNYFDNSRFAGTGLYVQDEVRLSERLDAVVGARYDRFRIRADGSDPAFGSLALRSSPAAVTGSGHVLYKLTRTLSAIAGVSQGFRAPNLDDATILGGIETRYEIPNAELRPERSWNTEYGVRAQARKGTFSLVAFRDAYRDLIDRAPATLNGLAFVDRNGNGVRDEREEAVFQRRNISRARVHGLEFESILNLGQAWTWTHSTTWTVGSDAGRDVPLTRIPPLNGASRLTWQSGRTWWLEGALVAAAAQRRLAPGDKTDIRIGPGGTAGYGVVHVRAGLRRTALAGLSVAVENAGNRRYRFHGSGIDRPGINLVVGWSRYF
jgi:hemoglobin/transferrin/lactoferrin receptor protein